MNRPGKERVEATVDLIYEAAMDASAFPRMFEALCGLVEANHGFFMLLGDRCIAAHAYNLSPEVQQTYNDLYSDKDPWYTAATARGLRGQVMTGQELRPTKELRHTDFYHDILVPDRVHDVMSVTIETPSICSAGFSFQRSRNEPFFDARDKAMLNYLLPHLRRMVKLRRTFEDHACLKGLSEASAGQFEFGVVILNDEGKISFTNPAAEAILTSGDALSSRDGRLATHADDREALSRAIAFALADDGYAPIGSEICIQRKSGRLPYALQIMPVRLKGQERFVLTPAARLRGVVVVITDPERQTKPPAALLQQMFGLTPTEASLATAIASGKSIPDIADERGVSTGTVRWHLKNVQAKTDTHRLAELVRLVGRASGRMPGS